MAVGSSNRSRPGAFRSAVLAASGILVLTLPDGAEVLDRLRWRNVAVLAVLGLYLAVTASPSVARATVMAGMLLIGGALMLGLAGCMGEGAVSYSAEIKPILVANCQSCHERGGSGYEASGFSMANYDDLMKGTKFGPMVIPGDSEGSNLIVLMEGRADPSIAMPHGDAEPVSKAEIDTIRRWIDQGANNN